MIQTIISITITLAFLVIIAWFIDYSLTKEQKRVDSIERVKRLYRNGRNIKGQFVKQIKYWKGYAGGVYEL